MSVCARVVVRLFACVLVDVCMSASVCGSMFVNVCV